MGPLTHSNLLHNFPNSIFFGGPLSFELDTFDCIRRGKLAEKKYVIKLCNIWRRLFGFKLCPLYPQRNNPLYPRVEG